MEGKADALSEEIIVVGDKVDLLGHQNRLYRTMIEDIYEGEFFLVGVPRYAGIPMPIRDDDRMFMVFYRESGRYILEVQAVRFETRGEVSYIWLHKESEPVKDQRREAFRLPLMIDVNVHEYSENLENKLPVFGEGPVEKEKEAVVSRDISVTGISLVTKENYEQDQNYLLKIYLKMPKGQPTTFYTCAKVRRIHPWREEGKNLVGFCYFGQTRKASEQISVYVLEEQRRQLKQKRLIENE